MRSWLWGKCFYITRSVGVEIAFCWLKGDRFSANKNIEHRKLLWHGTNVAVIAAILKSGLRIMPHSGGRVGKGIYFASENSKSACYGNYPNRISVIAVLDIWHTGSSWHYLGHNRGSRSYVRVHSHRRENIARVVSGEFLVETALCWFKGDRFGANKNIEHRKLLWHGTNVAVIAAILKTGLRIMPHSGGCVGKGIYFASESSKSACYGNNPKFTRTVWEYRGCICLLIFLLLVSYQSHHIMFTQC